MSLIDRLRQNEGLRLQVYDDATGAYIKPGTRVVGFPTIGVGTLISAPGGITNAEADYLLTNRVNIATTAARGLIPEMEEADPVRFDVLAEMCFQIGSAGVAKFVNTLAAMRSSRWDDAANGMLSSLWAQQTPKRAQALAQVMRTGVA